MKLLVVIIVSFLYLTPTTLAWQLRSVALSRFCAKSFLMSSTPSHDHAIALNHDHLAVTTATVAFLAFPSLALADAVDFSAISVARPVIDIFVNTLSLFFICRTVLSWYPKTDLKKFPYSLVAWPTEPLLEPVRSLIPPAFGVDISAIVWIMLLSFLREILTGQQGILTLMER